MGNALFESNYLDMETNEEGENSIEDIDSIKKAKYNFYLDREFLAYSDIDEDTKHLLKQKYTIKKINLIIKHVRKYLRKKKAKKKLFKGFTYLFNQKNLLKSNNGLTSDNPKDELNINTKYKADLIKEINDEEQKNIKLLLFFILIKFRKFR